MFDTIFITLALLFIKHWYIDFVIQTDEEVKHKGIYGNWTGIVHSLKHGLATLIIFIAVDVSNDIDVALAIKLAEIPPEEFHNLNPSFNKPVILSNANQQILLPFAHAEIFQENLKNYTKPLASWTAVQIKKTESLDQAAKTLGVAPDTLRDVNGIPKGMRIKAGSTVLIPKSSLISSDVSPTLAENASLSLEKPPPPPSANKCVKPANNANGSKGARQE